jgi:hypothetical protein
VELEVRVTELLLTLLEGNNDTDIPTVMIESLNFSTLLHHAQYATPNSPASDSELRIRKRKVDLARNAFRLIKMLGEVDPSKIPDSRKNELEIAFSTINGAAHTSIARIEIVTADRSIQRLYFPIPASCQTDKVIEISFISYLCWH